MSARSAADAAAQLALRRRGLVLRSSLLRAQAVDHAAELHTAMRWVDRVQDGWIWLRQRPTGLVLPAAAVATVCVWRKPSRLWRWPWRVWTAWKLWRRVSRHWA